MKKNIVEEFDKKYLNYADKIAVIDDEGEMTFAELVEKSVQVATSLLLEINDIYNQPIAVFLPKCRNAVVSDIAITYSGNIFMNLDIKLPLTRLKNIIETVKPKAIITATEYVSDLKDIGVPVLNFENLNTKNGSFEDNHKMILERLSTQIDTDPYCIINTSGSTGTPKGVVLNHRSFFDFYEWANEEYLFDGSEIVGSLSPMVFDIYNFELCLMMFSGATIILLNASLAIFPARLLQRMQETNVNFIFWVPTIMVNIANKDLLTKIEMTTLRTIWFAGEVFPTKQLNYWIQKLPTANFTNLYGPIEITLDCTFYRINDEIDEDAPLPIGRPCKNTDVLILNDNEEKCSIGEIGELCVRGTSLAMGYYNNPQKTAEAFVQNPLNQMYPELIYRTGDLVSLNEEGLILFNGRKDSLIKHMGYRIELGEIEHIIVNVLKLVPNCCVVYNKREKIIVLFYENTISYTVAEIKKALSKHLPRYMIPSEYVQLDLLPRNTNGKIDRLQLSNMINK